MLSMKGIPSRDLVDGGIYPTRIDERWIVVVGGKLRSPPHQSTNSIARYDPYMWTDRAQYAATQRRRLAEVDTTQVRLRSGEHDQCEVHRCCDQIQKVQCPDGKTQCESGQVCVGCFCTTFAVNTYVGGLR